MTDPLKDIPMQLAKMLPLALSANYGQLALETAKLTAMVEAELVPPIDAPDLDPGDRAAVDAEIDAELKK
jgi:hypothetical protein